jgi:hypothetical protein
LKTPITKKLQKSTVSKAKENLRIHNRSSMLTFRKKSSWSYIILIYIFTVPS